MSSSTRSPSVSGENFHRSARSAGIFSELQSLLACAVVLASVFAILGVVHGMHWPETLRESFSRSVWLSDTESSPAPTADLHLADPYPVHRTEAQLIVDGANQRSNFAR